MVTLTLTDSEIYWLWFFLSAETADTRIAPNAKEKIEMLIEKIDNAKRSNDA